ncbi:sensor histidine kinase [Desulfitibacter alkalitolerans]|uniref:sensor histidine kinase n=1 Tax=Desulfitibacter alkalitolerans TaxID=264641 RepID=UPI000A7E92B2|nr:PocR ligand-binding domain-containing protein [Desulfitibacter alkalitolerans]
MHQKKQLNQIIQLKVLKEIQESFSTSTDLATALVDRVGNPINHGMSNYTDLCKKLHSNHLGRECCMFSNFIAGQKSRLLGRPYIYKCHVGLVEISVPIIVENQFLGNMIAGQVKLTQNESSDIEKMPSPINWLKKPDYQVLYDKIQAVSRKKLEAISNTLFLIVNYIIEKHLSGLTQQELGRQRENLLREIQSRSDLENMVKEMEIKVLQQQINPHFMFNILNTISRLISLKQYAKAQEVLNSFSKMLRYALKHGNQNIVTLRRELEYIEKYLIIQNIRFGKRIKYCINVDSELLAMQIPFFSIQPIVENAVIHGLEPKEAGGTVQIQGLIQGLNLIITIKDNGIGMDKWILEHILSEDVVLPFSQTTNNNIGLKNVNKRLQLFFGDKFNLDIKSSLGTGTIVSLTFSNVI